MLVMLQFRDEYKHCYDLIDESDVYVEPTKSTVRADETTAKG